MPKKMIVKAKQSRSFKFFWAGVIIILFLLFFVFKGFPPLFMKQGALFFSQPLFFLKYKISNFIEDHLGALSNKADLLKENLYLKQKLAEVETEKKFCQSVFEENEQLKKVLSGKEQSPFLLAAVLARPGYGVYNSLIIDAGSKEGIEKGMLVTAFGNVLLGYVSDVSSSVSSVKMISYPGEETNVFINDKVSAIAVGRGGENLMIELPKDVGINIGDSVAALSASRLFAGIVEEIEKTPADSFQKIFFRLPVNVQELRHVYLIK